MNVYIASSKKHAGKISEDILVRDALIARGMHSEIIPLEKIATAPRSFDFVMLKSIWGYHKSYRRFLERIKDLKKKKIKLMNDYPFVFWNIDKYEYLREIARLGTIPTILLQLKGVKRPPELRGILSRACDTLGARIIVVKPRISESGYLTFVYKTGTNTRGLSTIEDNKQGGFIAQPYRSAIIAGELSVVMIGGEILYGIRRFPGILSGKKDAIYVRPGAISPALQKKAVELKKYFMKRFEATPDICRIDFLKNGSRYEILEVELIDPDLYFRRIPEKMKERAVEVLCRRFLK